MGTGGGGFMGEYLFLGVDKMSVCLYVRLSVRLFSFLYS